MHLLDYPLGCWGQNAMRSMVYYLYVWILHAKVHPNHCGLGWMGLSCAPLLGLGSDQRRFKVKWEIHLYLIYTA